MELGSEQVPRDPAVIIKVVSSRERSTLINLGGARGLRPRYRSVPDDIACSLGLVYTRLYLIAISYTVCSYFMEVIPKFPVVG